MGQDRGAPVRRALLGAVVGVLLISGAPAPAHADTYRDPRYEQVRQCIVHRESRGQYHRVNRWSGAGGAYQFMPRTARTVARWMGRPDLVYVPVQQWSKRSQDAAFWRLWDHGRGRSHWYSQSRPCW